MQSTLVLVDDVEAFRDAARRVLARQGYRIISCASGAEALEALGRDSAEILIADLNMPKMDGIELLQRAKKEHPALEVIVLTGEGTVEKAVEAMQLGAYHFLQKPLDPPVLLEVVRKALEKSRLVAENRQLRSQLRQLQPDQLLIGESPALREIKTLIRQVASSDVSVLITGESGTGKEVVADLLHALSPRRDRPLVKISCAAIPETLLESELFGHEKGAFTGAVQAKPGRFEAAHGGSLFLDEIGEMTPPLQAKLLRVLQDQRFQRVGGICDNQLDTRIMSATHVDLPRAIEAGRFRRDLYYRLNVVHLALPPLRERREDIPLLADHFLRKHAARLQREVSAISSSAMEQLLGHDWPGNVRELENTVQRALATAQGPSIERFELGGCRPPAHLPAPPPRSNGCLQFAVGMPLAVVEEQLIAATLLQCQGNKEQAARLLGVSVRTLYRRLDKQKTVS